MLKKNNKKPAATKKVAAGNKNKLTKQHIKKDAVKRTISSNNKKDIKAGEFRMHYHIPVDGVDSHPALITKRKKQSKGKKNIEFVSFTHSKSTKLKQRVIKNKELNSNINPKDNRRSHVIPIIQKDSKKKFSKKPLGLKITDPVDKSTIRNIKKRHKR